MPRKVSVGTSSFEKLRLDNAFYVDKTDFICQWWDNLSDVTAIMRPRRFGKTLTMDTVRCFFSTEYAGRGELFEGLSVWRDERYRSMQGTYPVLFLSFAEVKNTTFESARRNICGLIQNLYEKNRFLLEGSLLSQKEKVMFEEIGKNMPDDAAAESLRSLMDYLSRYYGKKVIMLLDEYDTPMQEAYVRGFWKELVDFLRPFFGTTFKGNPYLERGLMTGITRVAKESVFSDFNNLDVVTTTSDKYADCFGFTQQEVDSALEEFGLADRADAVKNWYDGFTFGQRKNIYNPWSITSFLDAGKLGTYWANTGSNSIISELIQRGSSEVKMDCERLLARESIRKPIDEQIVFSRLGSDDNALWSFMLASGYLKVLAVDEPDPCEAYPLNYTLTLTNGEVRGILRSMISGWFTKDGVSPAYHNFLKALLNGNVDSMNFNLNRITQTVFSFFDTGGQEPERFYHGFVLGLTVSLDNDYFLRSNRESGDGRYDVMLEPKDREGNNAIILELKVRETGKEKDLEETVKRALEQIEEKGYDRELAERGFTRKQIRKYGFAFDGKKVLIERGD